FDVAGQAEMHRVPGARMLGFGAQRPTHHANDLAVAVEHRSTTHTPGPIALHLEYRGRIRSTNPFLMDRDNPAIGAVHAFVEQGRLLGNVYFREIQLWEANRKHNLANSRRPAVCPYRQCLRWPCAWTDRFGLQQSHVDGRSPG